MTNPTPSEVVIVSSMSKVANNEKQTAVQIKKSESSLVLTVPEARKLIQELQLILINE